jgi:hypothetical protein
MNKARGLDSSMNYKKFYAAQRVRVQIGEANPYEASCIYIC